MFAFSALVALAIPFVVRADVTPSEPGPGSVYNTGATCRVTWTGDTDSPTAWKNMAIELMTGSNLAMVHLTTVATNLDGTTDGEFTYTCPDVTPNSAIYFYQFSAPLATDKTWTTRFAIASASGQTTPPPNATQPSATGGIDNIPWGTGALTDPSKATPPPNFAAGGNTTSASNSTAALPTTQAAVATTSTSRLVTQIASTTSTTTDTPTTTSKTNSGSLSSSFDVRVVMTALGMMLTALML